MGVSSDAEQHAPAVTSSKPRSLFSRMASSVVPISPPSASLQEQAASHAGMPPPPAYPAIVAVGGHTPRKNSAGSPVYSPSAGIDASFDAAVGGVPRGFQLPSRYLDGPRVVSGAHGAAGGGGGAGDGGFIDIPIGTPRGAAADGYTYAIRQARDTTAVPTPRAAGGFFDRVRQRSGGITPRPNTAAGAPANGGEYRAAGPSTGSVGGIPPPAGTPTLLTQCLGCDPSDNLDPISREIITFFRRMRNFLRIAPPREHWLVWCSLNFYICTVVTFWMLEPYQTVNDRVQSMVLYSWGARTDQRIWHHGESWRFVTSIFLHSGVAHFVSNMFIFLGSTWSLERRFGWFRIFPLYVISGIGGNLYSATYEGCNAVVGASGACFGMLGAIMVDFFKSPHTMKLRCTRLLWIFFATFQLIYGVAQDTKGVSNWSHTGGFVTAFALSAVWLPRMEGAVRVPRPVWVAAMAVCLGVLFFSFLVLPLNFYGKWPTHFAGQPKRCMLTCDDYFCQCRYRSKDLPCIMAQKIFDVGDIQKQLQQEG